MLLTRLRVTDVRNYASLDFAPAPGLNVLTGANAQGKSNLLEAIALLATGKSFRTTRESDIVRGGTAVAALAGEARLAAATVRLSCRLERGANGVRKSYAVNGRDVRYAAYLGRMRVVSFVPADVQLISGAPNRRRAMLNAALAQNEPAYYAALAVYGRYVEQKNALLRGAVAPDQALLETYDERLIEHGATVILARRAFAAALERRAAATHQAWVGEREGRLELSYVSNVDTQDATREGVVAAFRMALKQRRAAESARRVALVGPHRDDLVFHLDGKPLAAFGSQGQQRTAVLALKVAEYGELRERGAEAPLLLLDDVLSELDAGRREAFLRELGSFEQAFVTTTARVELAAMVAYCIRAGTVQRLG